MADINLNEFFKNIERDFVKLSEDAARTAANKAQKDIRTKADKFIAEYYLYRPAVYRDRRYALYHLVEDYYHETATASGIVIEFGVFYKPSNIRGVHRSKSKFHQSGRTWIPRNNEAFNFNTGNNGIPDHRWITDNFLDGVHPYPYKKDGKWEYTEIEDSQSSREKMDQFFDIELEGLVLTYMNTALLNAIRSYF